ERVSLQVARVVARKIEPVVAGEQILRRRLEPVDERHEGLRIVRQCVSCAAFLDASVPRTDVLADVAAVDLGAELRAIALWDRAGCLRPVGQTPRRIQDAWLVERPRGARVDAARAGA